MKLIALLLLAGIGLVAPFPAAANPDRAAVLVRFDLDVPTWKNSLSAEPEWVARPFAEFERAAASRLAAALAVELGYLRFVVEDNIEHVLKVRLYASADGSSTAFQPTFLGISLNDVPESDDHRLAFRTGAEFIDGVTAKSLLGTETSDQDGVAYVGGELEQRFAAALRKRSERAKLVKVLSPVPLHTNVFLLRREINGTRHHFGILPWSCEQILAGSATEFQIRCANELDVIKEHRTKLTAVGETFRSALNPAQVNVRGIVLTDPEHEPQASSKLSDLPFPDGDIGLVQVAGIHVVDYTKGCTSQSNDSFD